MCGIAGFISTVDAPELRRAAVQRMCDTMIHRGPDDGGICESSEATLGMRRLAIFDPANGRQPMISPDGRYQLVFNGAIYNFKALRASCERRGWQFRTECDTEVLLAALTQEGTAVLPRLRGMFAFALWDAHEHTLLAARDALGQKPLLYHSALNGALLFASESRALLASRQVPTALDPAAAADFLRWQSIPAPRTLHAAVRSLRPGSLLRWKAGRSEIAPWWSPLDAMSPGRGRPEPLIPATNTDMLRTELRAQLEDSIKAHVVADVPVGAFLSGGLDSAVIVALMARHIGPGLRTFSIGFEEADWSETAEAAATARHIGVEHHTHVLTGDAVAGDLDRILAELDQPTGDGLNTFYAARTARAGGVTVALSGLGSDELFGGYPSFHRLPRLARLATCWTKLPAALQNAGYVALERGNTSTRKLATTLRAAGSWANLALAQRAVLSQGEISAVLASGIPTDGETHPAAPALAAAWSELLAAGSNRGQPPFALLASAAETCGYMADLLLRDSDEFSMWHSLELRVPFVDLPLIEWAWAQNPALLFPAGAEPKAHLAAACADLLPPALLTRRKRGFSLPFARWLRGPLRPFMEETLAGRSAGRSGLFNPEAPGKLWRNFCAGSDDRAWSRVWSLAVLIHLANRTQVPAPA
ncbi:MAG: asparagine synthase (glutamine-hydrolyzing) [Opitutales bacterium]